MINLEERLNFDDPTLEETEQHQKMAEEIEFQQRCSEQLNYYKKIRYNKFIKAVALDGVRVEDMYFDIEIKKRHLREIMGYKVLIGNKGRPVLLNNAKHARISQAYLKTYNTAKRAMLK